MAKQAISEDPTIESAAQAQKCVQDSPGVEPSIWVRYEKHAIVLGSLFSAVAIVASACQYQRSAEYDRTKTAIDVFTKYLEFASSGGALSREELESSEPNAVRKRELLASYAMHMAEAIYVLQLGDRGWEDTALGIVKDNQAAILATDWRCDAMEPAFLALIRRRGIADLCPNSKR